MHSTNIFHKFYSFLRHKVLPFRDRTECPDFVAKYKSFPPERRYNMDQVPLPFVLSQFFPFSYRTCKKNTYN